MNVFEIKLVTCTPLNLYITRKRILRNSTSRIILRKKITENIVNKMHKHKKQVNCETLLFSTGDKFVC